MNQRLLYAFFQVVNAVAFAQLTLWPLVSAIQPFINHKYNSLFVIWPVLYIFQYNLSNSLCSWDNKGLVVLNF